MDFDFNSINQPTLEVVLPDKDHTELSLTVPSVSAIERLAEASKEIDEIATGNDNFRIQQVYQITADVLNCNRNGKQFTADCLKEYLNFNHIAAFFLEYMKFINNLKKEKN